MTVKFNHQTVKADVTFRGGGQWFGDRHGARRQQHPDKGAGQYVGDQVVVAGGRVVVDFQYVQNFQIVDTAFATGKFSMTGLWPGSFT